MIFDKELSNNKVARITVDYSRGDYNGKRGIFVRFDNLEILNHNGRVMERWSPYYGISVFCESMKRANAKTLKKWEDAINAIKETLFEAWTLDNRGDIYRELGLICA